MTTPDLIDQLDKAMKHMAAAHYGYLVDNNGHQIYINGNQCRSEAGQALTILNELQLELLEKP